MEKIIWMSDPHFTAQGDVLGHDPRARLDAAIAHVNANHADSDFCVISGDMVNRGTRPDYLAVSEALSALQVPLLPMVGNHDDRPFFREVFALPDTSMAKFVQYSIDTPDGLILCLDTQKTGADAGDFCATRSDWLRDTLQHACDKPVYIFLHHPPMALGLPMQDQSRMENGPAFLDLLTMFPNIRHLFIGHVHRPVTGTVRGIPFATMRSVLYQAPPPRPDWTWKTFIPAAEAPNLGILMIKNGDVTLQYQQFCDYRTGVAD